jgi:hypothetical protein
MDAYLLARIIGAVFWPCLFAVIIYGIGWLVARPRPEHAAQRIRRWFALAALAVFIATFIMTAGELIRERLT